MTHWNSHRKTSASADTYLHYRNREGRIQEESVIEKFALRRAWIMRLHSPRPSPPRAAGRTPSDS
ncbi:hypothetical protein HMPREF7545_0225 [Selenomonas noxia ATCC 43541]|nr:hypothetical protein HMPREF7545_0225 [Selenomonas noxia ATCC 43541]